MLSSLRSSRWSLQEIDILNFKSIRYGKAHLKQGVTVITGPNGSGKSNLVEAVAFALGVEPKELRVTTLNELCGRKNEKTEVNLTFTSSSSSVQKQCIQITCSIIEGIRSFKINNKAIGKEKLRSTLHLELGFAKDPVCWFIGQQSVQRIINASPKALFNTICFVSGTHQLIETKADVENQLEIMHGQLPILQDLIMTVEKSLESDEKLLHLLKRSSINQQEVVNTQRMLEKHEKEYNLLEEYQSNIHFQDLQKLSETLKNKLAILQKEVDQYLANNTSVLEVKVLSDIISELSESMSILKNELNTDLNQKEFLVREIDKNVQQLRQTESNHNHTKKKIAVCTGKLNSLHIELSAAEDNISSREAHIKVLQKPTSNSASLLAAAEKDLRAMKLDNDCTVTSTMTLTAYLTQIIFDEDSMKSTRNTLLAKLNDIQLRLNNSDIKESDYTENEKLLENCMQSIHDTEKQIFFTQQELANISKKLHIGSIESYNSDIQGDRGFLAELISPVTSLPKEYHAAVISLLSPFIGIRIVETNSAATEVLKEYKKHNYDGRIWVLERMNQKKSSGFEHIRQRFSEDLIDPLSLLDINKDMSKIADKIATYLICKQPSLVSTVIELNGACVTLDGNKHSKGSLRVHHHQTSAYTCNDLVRYSTFAKKLRNLIHARDELIVQKKSYLDRMESYKAHQLDLQTYQTYAEELACLANNITLIENKVAQLQDELMGLRNKHDYQLTCINQKVKELQLLRGSEAEKDKKEQMLTSSLQQFEEAKTHRDTLLLKIDEMVEMIKVLEASVEDIEINLHELTTDVNSMNESCELLDSTINSTTIELNEQEKQLADLTDKLHALQNCSDNTSTVLGQKKKLLHDCEVEYRAAQFEMKEFLQLHDVTNDTDVKIRAELGANYLSNVTNIDTRINELQQQLVQSRVKVDELIKERDNSIKGINKMRNNADFDEDNLEKHLSAKQAKLADLKTKTSAVKKGIQILLEGLTKVKTMMEEIHEATYQNLRSRVKQYFGDLVPSHASKADLVKVGSKLDEGLMFTLQSENSTVKSTSDLSGGEKSLLGLAFIFASALFRGSPLYLLDEADAALDEGNIQKIAMIVKKLFGGNQVLCVSHHSQFHNKDFNNIPVSIHEGATKLGD